MDGCNRTPVAAFAGFANPRQMHLCADAVPTGRFRSTQAVVHRLEITGPQIPGGIPERHTIVQLCRTILRDSPIAPIWMHCIEAKTSRRHGVHEGLRIWILPRPFYLDLVKWCYRGLTRPNLIYSVELVLKLAESCAPASSRFGSSSALTVPSMDCCLALFISHARNSGPNDANTDTYVRLVSLPLWWCCRLVCW